MMNLIGNLHAQARSIEKTIAMLEANAPQHDVICKYFSVHSRKRAYSNQNEYGDKMKDYKATCYHDTITALLENPNMYLNINDCEDKTIDTRQNKKKNVAALAVGVRSQLVEQDIFTSETKEIRLTAPSGHYRNVTITTFELTEIGKNFKKEWKKSFEKVEKNA